MNQDKDLYNVHLCMQDWLDTRNWLCIQVDNSVPDQYNLVNMNIRQLHRFHDIVNSGHMEMECKDFVVVHK